MSYYNVRRDRFDWVSALRENNSVYSEQFYDVDSLWCLFQRLGQRSYLEIADAFEWFITFFGECLKYDTNNELQNTYIQSNDRQIESILYLRPDHAEILTSGVTSISSNMTPFLSSAAAGLLRMGKRDFGLRLYARLFDMVWNGESTTDEKKKLVDNFIERLAAGYEGDSYLDEEIMSLLFEQSQRYSDTAWKAKIRKTIARNK